MARTGTQKVVFPPILSFIDNPEETLGVLDEMVAGSGWGTRELFLDHSKCTQLDHGAVSVVAALATQAQSRRILVNGRNPQDPVATDIIMAVGAPRLLRYISGPIPENFLSFRLRRVQTHRRTSAGRSTPHERIVQQIEAHLNKCVERFGFCLTDDSRRRLGGLLGEVCGNAEEHPGRPEWWASAYLQHQDDVYGTCYLTIFCLGETIYETLDGALPKPSLPTYVRHGARKELE